jgi:hypothetical protein
MWSIEAVENDDANAVTDGRQSVWGKPLFAFFQFLHAFPAKSLVKIYQ